MCLEGKVLYISSLDIIYHIIVFWFKYGNGSEVDNY